MTTRPPQPVYRAIQFTAASTTEGQAGGGKLTVALGDLIAYEENQDFTRLTLTGSRVLHVKENAGEIEQLVRQASRDPARLLPCCSAVDVERVRLQRACHASGMDREKTRPSCGAL
jgi:hypothetical protein